MGRGPLVSGPGGPAGRALRRPTGRSPKSAGEEDRGMAGRPPEGNAEGESSRAPGRDGGCGRERPTGRARALASGVTSSAGAGGHEADQGLSGVAAGAGARTAR